MTSLFRTPEEVAPELGLKPATVRRLARETGICTRLERGRITLTAEDTARLVDHIKGTQALKDDTNLLPQEEFVDPFAA